MSLISAGSISLDSAFKQGFQNPLSTLIKESFSWNADRLFRNVCCLTFYIFCRPEMFTLGWCETVCRRGGASSSTGLPDPGRDNIQYRRQSQKSMRLRMFFGQCFRQHFTTLFPRVLETVFRNSVWNSFPSWNYCSICTIRICKHLKSPGIDSKEAWRTNTSNRLSYRPGWKPKKVYKYGLCTQVPAHPKKIQPNKPNKRGDLKQQTHYYWKILKQVNFKMERLVLHCCLLYDIFSLDPGSQRDT